MVILKKETRAIRCDKPLDIKASPHYLVKGRRRIARCRQSIVIAFDNVDSVSLFHAGSRLLDLYELVAFRFIHRPLLLHGTFDIHLSDPTNDSTIDHFSVNES